jgi:hypothetical protein
VLLTYGVNEVDRPTQPPCWSGSTAQGGFHTVVLVLQADLVANIADLVDKGVITGVADVRDESDRTGMRIVVEARSGSASEVTQAFIRKQVFGSSAPWPRPPWQLTCVDPCRRSS